MPIYEFKCKDCGTITENLVFPINQANYCCTCRNCGGNRTERIMSRPAALAGRNFDKRIAVEPAPVRARGSNRDVDGGWPENDNYIKIKGQQ